MSVLPKMTQSDLDAVEAYVKRLNAFEKVRITEQMATRIIGYLVDDVNPPRPITEQMSTSSERGWTAHLVLSSEHAGLRPHFKRLEDEFYRALARIDEPRDVRDYIQEM